MKKSAQYGYTIIELLVVIAIIGGLASIVIVQFIGAQSSARDTRRQADLKQYANALEIFSSQNDGVYPDRSGGVNVLTLCGGGGPLDGVACADDPSSPGAYRYRSANSGSEYVLWVPMEKTGDFFILCSSGDSGVEPSAPTSGTCPL